MRAASPFSFATADAFFGFATGDFCCGAFSTDNAAPLAFGFCALAFAPFVSFGSVTVFGFFAEALSWPKNQEC